MHPLPCRVESRSLRLVFLGATGTDCGKRLRKPGVTAEKRGALCDL